MQDDAGTKLRVSGWHQGAIIAIPAEHPLLREWGEGVTHGIVASQDCDIVASSATEPAVDIIPAVLHADPENDLLYGKNPRRLCVRITNGEYATVDIRNRQSVTKTTAVELGPVIGLSMAVRERKSFAKWLGKRYTRDAFPDAYNERLRTVKSKLEALSKKPESGQVTAILMMLDTDAELPPGVAYKVAIWFTCRTSTVENEATRAVMERFARTFVDALRLCSGIEVARYEVKGHFDVTLEDLELMKRFDYDYRSEAPNPGGEGAQTS